MRLPDILFQDPCCRFNDCMKILNQKYEEARCEGCDKSDYSREKDVLDRYIELEKLAKLAINSSDMDSVIYYLEQQGDICATSATSGGAVLRQAPIYGCTDANATYYNPSATHPCYVNGLYNGCCEDPTPPIDGCTDPLASNYNPLAVTDDGTCSYIIQGCTDPAFANYNAAATVDDGTCTNDCLQGCDCDGRHNLGQFSLQISGRTLLQAYYLAAHGNGAPLSQFKYVDLDTNVCAQCCKTQDGNVEKKITRISVSLGNSVVGGAEGIEQVNNLLENHYHLTTGTVNFTILGNLTEFENVWSSYGDVCELRIETVTTCNCNPIAASTPSAR